MADIMQNSQFPVLSKSRLKDMLTELFDPACERIEAIVQFLSEPGKVEFHYRCREAGSWVLREARVEWSDGAWHYIPVRTWSDKASQAAYTARREDSERFRWTDLRS